MPKRFSTHLKELEGSYLTALNAIAEMNAGNKNPEDKLEASKEEKIPYLDKKKNVENIVKGEFEKYLNKIDLQGHLILDFNVEYKPTSSSFFIEIEELQDPLGNKLVYDHLNKSNGAKMIGILAKKLQTSPNLGKKFQSKEAMGFCEKYHVKSIIPLVKK